MDERLRLKLIEVLKNNFSNYELDKIYDQSSGTLSDILEDKIFSEENN